MRGALSSRASLATRAAHAAFVGLAMAVVLLVHSAAALARDVPPLQGRVNDTANLLSPGARARLEQRLLAYEAKTGQQFALLTIDTLDGDSIEEFSLRTVEAWKLGKKGKDDGLLLLIVAKDRKSRVEVGYGLEGDVTDATSSRVLREIIAPAFRRGDYDGGIDAAFTRLMQVASGQAVADTEPTPAVPAPQRRQRGGSLFGVLLVFLFFVLPLIGRALRPRRTLAGRALDGIFGAIGAVSHTRGGWGGGGFGGGGFRGGGGGGFGGGGGSFGGGGASGSW